MAYEQEERDVKCPFFVKMMPNKIVCESYIKNSSLQLVFANDRDRQKHLQCICNNLEMHKVCRRYKMLSKFWEELGDE